jgi:alpha-tubulin suppressor-like RCC1 family protein
MQHEHEHEHDREPLEAFAADQPRRATTRLRAGWGQLRLVTTAAAVIGAAVAFSYPPMAFAAANTATAAANTTAADTVAAATAADTVAAATAADTVAAVSTAPGPAGIDAGVMTWGEGDHGELGDGLTDSRLRPALYAGPELGFTQVSMTAQHALALADDGTVWGWGDNTRDQVHGQVNAPAFYQAPVQVTGISNVRQVATGGPFSLAVTADGSVYQWGEDLVTGDNTGGPDTFDLSAPTLVSGVSNIVQVSAYATHALLLSADGSVYAWGDNPDGVLGTGDTSRRAHPTKISGLPPITAIATGLDHSLAAAGNGLVYAWGDNSFGQLGLGPGGPSQNTSPAPVLGLSASLHVKQLAAGFSHSLALFTNGTVYAWGANSYGQLGDGSSSDFIQRLPEQLPGFSNATSIAAGPYASLAVESGHLWAWGNNAQGQLGDGSISGPANVPQQVPDLSGVVSAATGIVSSAAAVRQPASLSMTLSPPAATVNAGDSATTTVSFNPSRGVAGRPVNLSVSGLLAGATASFSDPAPDAGATSALTVTTGEWTPGGVYHLAVNASAGSALNPVSASATYDLIIRPGLAVTLSPADGTIVADGSVTTQVSLTLGSGFSGAVNLAAINLPDGTTAAFSSGDGMAKPATLTLTSAGTPSGQYDIHVTATTADGTRTKTAIFELTITGQAGRDNG